MLAKTVLDQYCKPSMRIPSHHFPRNYGSPTPTVPLKSPRLSYLERVPYFLKGCLPSLNVFEAECISICLLQDEVEAWRDMKRDYLRYLYLQGVQ